MTNVDGFLYILCNINFDVAKVCESMIAGEAINNRDDEKERWKMMSSVQ